jgi:hypothetical protein
MDDAIRIGHENRQTLELARRHCLNMQFVEAGGRDMAEEATGLPISMRQVRCPVAFGSPIHEPARHRWCVLRGSLRRVLIAPADR